MFKEITAFNGGINNTLQAHLIPSNQGVYIANSDIANGAISASKGLKYNGVRAGKYATYYKAQDVVVDSAEDRFYVEWADLLYWSNSAGDVKRYDGTTVSAIGGHVAPSVACGAVAGTAVATLEGDYTYAYTYVNDGFESPPSPFKTVLTIAKTQINITFTDTPPAGVTHRRIYRAGGINPTHNHLVELPIATLTYADGISDFNISREELTTQQNDPVPTNLDMMIEKDGVFFGAVGNKVHFSQAGQPEYWSDYNFVTLPKNVTGLGAIGSAVIAWTDSSMYMITGDTVANVTLKKLPYGYGCRNKRTVQNVEGVLIWVSKLDNKDALCMYNGSTVTVLSRYVENFNDPTVGESAYGDYDAETYATLSFVIKNSIVSNRKYLLFLDGRVVVVDFNDGVPRISYYSDTIEGAYNYNESLIVIKADGNDYEFFPDYANYRNMTYRTGELVADKFTTRKEFRQVKVKFEGAITTHVLVDGTEITSTTERIVWMPSETYGTTIQFVFKSVGYGKVTAVGYEYTALEI